MRKAYRRGDEAPLASRRLSVLRPMREHQSKAVVSLMQAAFEDLSAGELVCSKSGQINELQQALLLQVTNARNRDFESAQLQLQSSEVRSVPLQSVHPQGHS